MEKQAKKPTNCRVALKDNGHLALDVDIVGALSKGEVTESSNGKSWIIGTTHGFQKITKEGMENVSFSLNVCISKEKYHPENFTQKPAQAPKSTGKDTPVVPAQPQIDPAMIAQIVSAVMAQISK